MKIKNHLKQNQVKDLRKEVDQLSTSGLHGHHAGTLHIGLDGPGLGEVAAGLRRLKRIEDNPPQKALT